MRRAEAASREEAYDGFISYSHAVDGRLAPAIQTGLHRFAKPWHRLRALRVFRDQASLSANPALWSSIVRSLEGSRWFVLLASADAARSEWVGREVEHWCSRKPSDHLLIVVTEGEVEWDDEQGDFDWDRTTALPAKIQGAFAEEPRFVDLRWARRAEDVSVANARFRDVIADIAAPLHGRSKDELLGEDVRQHRRTRRLVRGAVATLAALLALAVVAAVVAIDQRDEARTQARLALSRQLAAEALSAGDDQLDLALLLAAQAYATEPTAQARGSLAEVLLRSPHLVGFLPGAEGARQLALSPDGSLLAVGEADGTVTLWDPTGRRELRRLDPPHGGGVTGLAFGPDGAQLASVSSDGVVAVWETATGSRISERSLGGRLTAVAFDGEGGLLAAAREDGVVGVWPAGGGALVHPLRAESVEISDLRFAANDTLVAGTVGGSVTSWDLSEDPPRPSSVLVGGGMPLVSAYSEDGSLFAADVLGEEPPYVFDVRADRFLHAGAIAGPATQVEAMAFSPDGRLLVTVGEGRVIRSNVELGEALDEQLAGVAGKGQAVAVGPRGRTIAAAGARGVAVWDLREHALVRSLRAEGATPLESVPNALRGSASAAFSPDGRLLAWSLVTNGVLDTIVVWDLERDEELLRFPGERVVGFSPDGDSVASEPFFDGSPTIVDLASGDFRKVDDLPWKAEETGASTEGAGQPWATESTTGLGASITLDGTVTLWETARRQPIARLAIPGAFDFSFLTFDSAGSRLAVATPGGAMSIIDVGVDSWRARICSVVGRGLTESERRLHIGSVEVPPACG